MSSMIMPARMMDLAKHNGPEDFKARTNKLLTATLAGMKVLGNDVLVATYVEPEKTAGGIFKPNKTVQEGLFQGHVGLVLKVGSTAFKYARGGYNWEGPKADVGDWILFRFADAWEVYLSGVSCRVVDAECVRAVITNPETVY